jgi:anthranilate phosphoribosyltransferase
MTAEHPFAAYVRILGRGRTLSRSLTVEEAEDAMAMILRGEVRPEQLGAFLMLLRVKEETPEEIAGFVRGARSTFRLPDPLPRVDLDWSSYAGKRRQLPWFLLAALTLAQDGLRIFMHGTEGHTPGRLYTRATLEALGLPVATTLTEAAGQIEAEGFASLARMLNPFDAPYLLQGIFHPSYMSIHQGAARLLGQPHMAVFRGEGGEIERRPTKPCEVLTVDDGALGAQDWPPLLPGSQQPRDEEMDLGRLVGFWRGEVADDYATAAVTGTLAIALRTLGRAEDPDAAQALAETLWAARDRDRLQRAA